MDGLVGQLAVVAALVLLNALFAGSEMAFVSLRESRVRRLEHRGGGGRALARLARDPNRFLATIQIGITLAGFLASATAAVSLARPLVGPLRFLGGAAEPVAIVLVTMVLTFLTLVVGELAPKRLAMQRAETWALLAARPLDLLATLVRPGVWLLSRTSDLLVRVLGGDPGARGDQVTQEELRDLVATQSGFTQEQRTIISGAFDIAARKLRQLIVPRGRVVHLAGHTPAATARAVLAEAGHSRAPVVRGHDLDDVLGVVHLRDLLDDDGTAATRARPALLLPSTLGVSEALRRMKAERQHLALVIDENGSVDGIVTLEDLLEEIVGEIYDETDRDVSGIERNARGDLLLPGTFPVHDLPDLGVHLSHLPAGSYTTVAGLVIALLGHIPTGPGERVEVEGWTAEVTGVERHAVTAVRLSRSRPSTPPA